MTLEILIKVALKTDNQKKESCIKIRNRIPNHIENKRHS